MADGRDLLYQIIPKNNKKIENRDEDDEVKEEESSGDGNEWLPSMNLFELIQCIPDFISETLIAQKSASKDAAAPMLGKFYLGLQYDY